MNSTNVPNKVEPIQLPVDPPSAILPPLSNPLLPLLLVLQKHLAPTERRMATLRLLWCYKPFLWIPEEKARLRLL